MPSVKPKILPSPEFLQRVNNIMALDDPWESKDPILFPKSAIHKEQVPDKVGSDLVNEDEDI